MFNNRLVKRSWGWWLVLLNCKHFKIKLLRFEKNKSCSMQYHNFRNELWLFLSGYGWMYPGLDSRGYIKTPGDWYAVPAGKEHKFWAAKKTLVLEIQYGDRCEESDIVRI